MPQDFIKPNTPSLNKLVIGALDNPDNRTPAQAAERLLAELHGALHMVVPAPSENENLYGRATQFTPAPTMPAPNPNPTHSRVVYPHGNSRFEIFGMSEGELDAQEDAIRKMYQQ